MANIKKNVRKGTKRNANIIIGGTKRNLMENNWKQVWAKRKSAENRILSICPNLPPKSGIYVFTREENGIKYGYIGQAKSLLRRCAEHLLGYQHIDNSLKKHGLYDKLKNPNGYKLSFTEYAENELDRAEQETIKFFANQGYQLKNKTIGGQGQGKEAIEEHSTKTYRQGVAHGYEKCRKEINEFFEKYLDYGIKEKPNKIKERKYNEFTEWLKGEKNEIH